MVAGLSGVPRGRQEPGGRQILRARGSGSPRGDMGSRGSGRRRRRGPGCSPAPHPVAARGRPRNSASTAPSRPDARQHIRSLGALVHKRQRGMPDAHAPPFRQLWYGGQDLGRRRPPLGRDAAPAGTGPLVAVRRPAARPRRRNPRPAHSPRSPPAPGDGHRRDGSELPVGGARRPPPRRPTPHRREQPDHTPRRTPPPRTPRTTPRRPPPRRGAPTHTRGTPHGPGTSTGRPGRAREVGTPTPTRTGRAPARPAYGRPAHPPGGAPHTQEAERRKALEQDTSRVPVAPHGHASPAPRTGAHRAHPGADWVPCPARPDAPPLTRAALPVGRGGAPHEQEADTGAEGDSKASAQPPTRP
ncbi:hypothetical protein SUDANB19_02991 [Streptomyces sp. enrichment culture]